MSDMQRHKSQQLSKHTTSVENMSARERNRNRDRETVTADLKSAHTHSPSKPSAAQHSSFCSCRTLKKGLYACSVLLLSLLLPSVLYYFINDADIIDDHFDLTAMEALTVADKLSIRVSCPDNRQQLQKFVAHYAICPQVIEIGIVATPSCQSLEGIPFQYLKVRPVSE